MELMQSLEQKVGSPLNATNVSHDRVLILPDLKLIYLSYFCEYETCLNVSWVFSRISPKPPAEKLRSSQKTNTLTKI